jgi:8-oxo-dGTP diphosphatase
MANSELYNKNYQIPSEVLKHIQNALISFPTGDGVKRAKFILRNGNMTYQAIKGLKNFFDYYNPETTPKSQYELAGGDLMKNYIETTLNNDRNAVKKSKEIKRDANVDVNLGTRAYNAQPSLNEEKEKKMIKNAIVIILNGDNKVLLLKRSSDTEWMPNKYAFAGGRVDKDEAPKSAAKREVLEETGIELDNLIESFKIEDIANSVNYIFLSRYSGEPTDIKLSEEHTNYGWYSISEIKYLDTAPNLMNYLELAFKNEK